MVAGIGVICLAAGCSSQSTSPPPAGSSSPNSASAEGSAANAPSLVAGSEGTEKASDDTTSEDKTAGPPSDSSDASTESSAAESNVSGAPNELVKVDENLPAYEAVEGVSGTIKSVGSDSMNNLMTFWTQGFQKFYPNVQVEVEGKGSATAPPALIAGTANFGPMSREMKKKELDEFESKYGYQPTELKTSIDMLAVYVHKDNPIEGLTLQQIDAIFSKNRKGGYPEDISKWGQLGLSGKWTEQPISLYGRNSASGTNGYFKEHALFGGDYKDSVKQLPGSASVVQAIATNVNAIGYSGIGYMTADVRAVPLAAEDGEDFVPAEPENGFSRAYPLSRYLYLYVNYEPESELDPLRREFIRYVFSREGQQEVLKDGYLPVDSKTAASSLKAVGIGVEK
ncbi:MAG TPA: phosphate ABC transporter substrate-binding protein [Pirellulales bacterium]|nr:phosphate ABC transporter substrate-binding protein [Pirellulales bacterium]